MLIITEAQSWFFEIKRVKFTEALAILNKKDREDKIQSRTFNISLKIENGI